MVSRADQQKAVERAFARLDKDEDGCLSGTEIGPFKAADANNDGRVTKEEFVAAVTKEFFPARPEPAIGKIEAPAALTLLIETINSGNAASFSSRFDANTRKTVDEPIFSYLLLHAKSVLGEGTPPAADLIKLTRFEHEGQAAISAEAEVKFSKEKARCEVVVVDGKVAGFRIVNPLMNDIFPKLLDQILRNKKLSEEFSQYYRPGSAAFIGLVDGGKDEAAFARFHPEVQEQLKLESAQAFFAKVRNTYGRIKSLEFSGTTFDIPLNDKPKGFSINFDLVGEKGAAEAKVKYQFVGLQAVLVGFEAPEKGQDK